MIKDKCVVKKLNKYANKSNKQGIDTFINYGTKTSYQM